MKIGIIGAGGIASRMAITLQPLKGAECYAIASRDIKRAQAFADKYGFERAYGSYADMLNDPRVELVYIATPHSHHYEHIKLCLNHGKHVLCEKSFCANAKQAEEVMLMAEDRGLLLTEAIWTRYMPMRETINKILKSGIIGTPTSLSANLGYPLQHVGRIIRPELAGGALLDVGVYVLNFASMIFGNELDSIAANCVKLDTGVDAQENIMLTYKDGKMASLYATILAQTDRRGHINGSDGYIEIENINNYETVRVYNLDRKIVGEYAAPTQITGYEYEVVSAMKAIREGRIECPEMPHIETLQMMQLMDSIRGAWGIVYPFEQAGYVSYKKYSGPVGSKKQPEKSVVKKLSESSTGKLPKVDKSEKTAEPKKAAAEPVEGQPVKKMQVVADEEARSEQPVKKEQTGRSEQPSDSERQKAKALERMAMSSDMEIPPNKKLVNKVMPDGKIRKVLVDKETPKKDLSMTGKIRELSSELRVEEVVKPGGVTDKLKDIDIESEMRRANIEERGRREPVEKVDMANGFQRRRMEPGILKHRK